MRLGSLGLLWVSFVLFGCSEGAGSADGAPDGRSSGGDARVGAILAAKKCSLCHDLEGDESKVGEPIRLVMERLRARMPNYPAYAEELRRNDPSRYASNARQIDAIVGETDPERRVALWLASYLVNPTFDDRKKQMLPQSLSKGEKESVIAWLLSVQ